MTNAHLVLKNGKEKQSLAGPLNLTNVKNPEIASYNDNAYCPRCRQLWLNVAVPYRHVCHGVPHNPTTIPDQRAAICNGCMHNVNDVCLKLKEILPQNDCRVSVGVNLLRSRCPEGHWRAIEYKCESCRKLTTSRKGVDACIHCGHVVGGDPLPIVQRPPLSIAISDEERARLKRKYAESSRRARENMRRERPSPFKYKRTNVTGFLSVDQLAQDAKTLSTMAPPNVGAVIGVARSGIAPASIVSMMLHVPLLSIRQTKGDIVEVGNGWRLGGSNHITLPPGKIPLVVDDTVMTGNSTRHITQVVSAKYPNAMYGALYVNPTARVKPDIWVHDLPWPHILEWNVFNSVLSPNMALDFDGVLCHDCHPQEDDDGERYLRFINEAVPLYIPRKVAVPLIVTARIEKYREPTLKWLDRHGIRVHNLIMHPAKTLAERNADNIAAYKARHYSHWCRIHKARPAPHMFIESDDRQARAIHEISHEVVVCPHSKRIYR